MTHMQSSRQRKPLALIAVACIACAISIAQAAECQLSFDNPKVDYGRLTRSRGSVHSTLATYGPMRRTLSAVCPTPTQLAITFRGNAGSGKALNFGGGSYAIRVVSAQLDSQSVQPVRVANLDDAPETPAGGFVLKPEDGIAPAGGAAVRGKRFDVQLEITASIPNTALGVADTTGFEALGDFDLLTRP